jgi:uncharacterized repeat protein (TIGR03803 family)
MNKATLLKIACILFAFCAPTAIASLAQVLTTLHSFTGYPNDGTGPASALARGSDGDYYGTTGAGGDNCMPSGCGTVFKITPGGTETTLYSFCSQNNCADGWTPTAGLVQATDGNFYGTTYAGGTSTHCDYGCGTIFRITPGGTLTTLYSFCSRRGCSDGQLPDAALVPAPGSNFYGSTGEGGTSNDGTVFRLTLLRECSVCRNVE